MNDLQSEKMLQLLERIALSLETLAQLQLQLKAAEDEEDAFEAEELVPELLDGETYWKVRGGRFKKHGVRIWPEVLEAAGFQDLEIKKVQLEPGWIAHFVRNEETGKVKKVVRLERARNP